MTRRFAFSALLLWLAAFGLTAAIVGAGVPAADLAIADTLHTFAVENMWLAWLARVFAALGSGFVLAPLTVVVVVGLYRKHRWYAVWVAACGIGGIVISQTVKRLVGRPRPVWESPLHELASPSFPSGHSMAGIYGYVAFGIVAWALGKRALGVALMTLGLLMGPSRVVFGVHWPSDVLAGWLFASAWICTVTAVLWWQWGPPATDAPDRAVASDTSF